MTPAKMIRIGDLVEITSGFAFKSESFSEKVEGMPLIRIRDVVRGTTETYYLGEYDEEYIIKNGDILIGMDGEFNLAVWKGGAALLNQRVCKIQSNSTSILNEYLCYILPKKLKEIEDKTPFVTVKHLSVKTIKDIQISLPSLEEQKRIVRELDTADALRQKRKQAIALLDDYLKAVFLEMFGDPVMNPKKWASKKLGEMIDFMTSGSRGWAKYYADSGDVFLRIQNVGRNHLKIDDICFINPPKTAESKRTKVKPGDVLLSITADLGRTAVIPEGLENAYISQHLALLRFKACYQADYIAEFLASQGGATQMTKLNKGGTKAGLNFQDIKSLQILIPDIKTQEQYLIQKKYIQSLKQIMLSQSQELDLNFEALVDKILN